MKLAMTLAATAALSRSIVPAVVTQLKLRFSDELFQLAMVGYCMSCAWICGKLGLSHELGAFLAGIMVSSFEYHDSVSGSTEQARDVPFPAAPWTPNLTQAARRVSCQCMWQGLWSCTQAVGACLTCQSCLQVRNVFTGLFLASIGLIISPVFIWEHLRLLSAGAAIVLLLKACLITFVVWNFRTSWNTSLVVGVSLAQVCCQTSFSSAALLHA
jgi:monovalent cation:H+ antiporter-2, CPA2 family